ncbi:unnamed protein product [Brassica napus]|uniref:(rape) hypothetical protein n=1 Tax=Brassica napus TaxID=3708 RepID=A0A816SX46_BRANA|nr:unnamed protein product [Brassica napus]
MAASRLCSAAAIAAAFTSMSTSHNLAYADSRFRIPFFSSLLHHRRRQNLQPISLHRRPNRSLMSAKDLDSILSHWKEALKLFVKSTTLLIPNRWKNDNENEIHRCLLRHESFFFLLTCILCSRRCLIL